MGGEPRMSVTISGISSMATRRVLAELSAAYRAVAGESLAIEAVGGVDAAKRVRAGETFDLVLLADDALAKLEAEGWLVAGSRVGFVRSPMAIAVRSGAPGFDIASEAAVREALTHARSIGYSTGPSGAHLLAVLKGWGLDPEREPQRFVQARPGVPVARLVAEGAAEIGVQQLSELLGEPGVEVLGLAPAPVQSVTMFSVGVGARSQRAEAARAAIAYLNGAAADAAKRRCGMEPATE